MSINFVNGDKLDRAQKSIKEGGGDVKDEKVVLSQYLKFGGLALDEKGKAILLDNEGKVKMKDEKEEAKEDKRKEEKKDNKKEDKRK